MQETKIGEIDHIIGEMQTYLSEASTSFRSLDEVEGRLFAKLLSLGKTLLGHYIDRVECQLDRAQVISPQEDVVSKGRSSRQYRSIFGLIEIDRQKYYSQEAKSMYPLDAVLNLPKSRYSYLLDDWLSYGSVEMDFSQSAGLISHILGQDLSAMQSARRTYALAEEVESYYAEKEVEGVEEVHTHLSVGFDGKGIPIRRSETERALESPVSRLAKGKRKDVKREVTVSLSSSFTAKKRSAEEIITALFELPAKDQTGKQTAEKEKEKHKWHEQNHVRGFLSNKPKAVGYGIEQLIARDPAGKKPIVVLIDGAPALENRVKITLADKGIEDRVDAYILDFIHLLEYVWKVANAYLGEKHPEREAWVKAQVRMLLNSQWEAVCEKWKEIRKTQELSQHKQNLLDQSITYLSNRPHMLDYKTFLEKGYPITTGAIESACGHFVKSRMERNAMHWGKKGAQKMLDIRAVKKNLHWNDYIQFFIKKQHAKLYPWAA